MQFEAQVKVLGAKWFNDVIEGQQHDFTTLYIEVPLDESKGTAKGYATQEYKWGSSGEFQKIKHLPFPFHAVAKIEIVTSGRQQKQRVVELKPVERAKAGAAA